MADNQGDFLGDLILALALNGERGYVSSRQLTDGRFAVVVAGVTLNAQVKVAASEEASLRGYDAVF